MTWRSPGWSGGVAAELDYPEDRFRAEAGLLDGVGAHRHRPDRRPVLDQAGRLDPRHRRATDRRRAQRPGPGRQGQDVGADRTRRRPEAGVRGGARAPGAARAVGCRGDGHARARRRALRHRRRGPDVRRGPGGVPRRPGTAPTPVDIGIGGSIPFIATFQEMFPDAAILVTGVEDPDARAHGPNESLHLGEFARVCLAEALLLANVAVVRPAALTKPQTSAIIGGCLGVPGQPPVAGLRTWSGEVHDSARPPSALGRTCDVRADRGHAQGSDQSWAARRGSGRPSAPASDRLGAARAGRPSGRGRRVGRGDRRRSGRSRRCQRSWCWQDAVRAVPDWRPPPPRWRRPPAGGPRWSCWPAALRGLAPAEVEAGAAYLAGELRQRQIGVGWAGLRELPPPAGAATLTVARGRRRLAEIGARRGAGSQARRRTLLAALFAAATADEQRLLAR